MSSHHNVSSQQSSLHSTHLSPTRKKQMLDAAISDIEQSEFVAIDLEFSGLFRIPTKHRVFQNYFAECVNSVNNFITGSLSSYSFKTSFNNVNLAFVQAGAPRMIRVTKTELILLEMMIFGAWLPIIFMFSLPRSDSSTLSWLAGNGFSFDEWIKQGFDYARLAFLQNLSLCASPSQMPDNFKRLGEEGLQRIISAIVNNQKPIIVHNGLLDILHIHDKFIDSIPLSSKEFFSEWLRIFTGGVFDTKHIAVSGKYSVMQLTNDSGTVLCSLHNHLLTLQNYRTHLCMAPRYYAPNDSKSNTTIAEENLLMTGDYFLSSGHNQISSSQKSKPHEAGYDAFITAQIFIMQSELYHAKNNTTASTTTEHSTEPSAMLVSSAREELPHNWLESPEFGHRFRDVLELAKISPGKLELNVLANEWTRLHSSSPAPHIRTPSDKPDPSYGIENPTSHQNHDSKHLYKLNQLKPSNQTKMVNSNLSLSTLSNQIESEATPPSKRRLVSESESRTSTDNAFNFSKDFSKHKMNHSANLGIEKEHPPSSTWALPLRGYFKPSRPFFSKYSNAMLYSSNLSAFKSHFNLIKPQINLSPIFPNHKIDLRKKKH